MVAYTRADETDPRLDQLLQRWEELCQQGEKPSAEELCSTCPELAGELARRIALLRAFDPLLADISGTTAVQPGPGPAGGRRHESATAQAEYRDLRYHDGGGLGEVYLARNAELNREVALKFLKPARAGDPASRRRFLQEAEITGRLEHPGVVPIYTLGCDGAGAPCYAMRFIRGRSLQKEIEAFHAAEESGRDPAERSLALRELLARFGSICNTVAYAHSRSILHRDLKPGNVMLGPYDETLVVDWGLAKPFARDDPAGSAEEEALTPSSGSGAPTVGVVGTLRYMSPEQAREQPLDPVSDIFSLGAILYAILTGAAPYRSGAYAEILEQVKQCAFPAPRQIKPEIPRALEAVCLKAMAARPEGRYATALELAADVKRWLADEPVTAWREPVALRARRWMRRHRTLVTSTVAVLVFSLLGLAGFAGVLAGMNRELDRQRLRAEARETLAIDAVKKFRDAVSTNPELKYRTELNALRKTLLKEPLEFFGQLRDQLQADGDTRPEALSSLAGATLNLAKTTREIGSIPDAIRSYGDSIDIMERLVREHPTIARYQRELAVCHNNLGNLLTDTGRLDEAMSAHQQALTIRQNLAHDQPSVLEYQSDLAASRINMGQLLSQMGRRDEALKSYRTALAILEPLARDHPAVTEFKARMALCHNNIGAVLYEMGRRVEALESHREALAIRQRLADEHPADAEYQSELAMSYYNLGMFLSNSGHPAEGRESYLQAVAIQKLLVRDHPSVTEYQRALAMSYTNIGFLMDHDEALKFFGQALEILERVARENPSVSEYQSDVALGQNNVAWALHKIAWTEMAQGQSRQAREHLERAVEQERAALALLPGHADYQRELRALLLSLTAVHQALNQPDEAMRVTREVAELSRGNGADLYQVACASALSVPLTRGEPQQTLAREAVQALEAAVAAGWTDAGKTSRDPSLAPLRARDDFRRLLAKLFDDGFPNKPFVP
jgi:serine/threonine-protein kinase